MVHRYWSSCQKTINYMYLKHSNHRFQLIFIFVSDDMEWVRKHMRRKIRKEFNIFLASNKDDMHPDAIGNMLYSITLSRISTLLSIQYDKPKYTFFLALCNFFRQRSSHISKMQSYNTILRDIFILGWISFWWIEGYSKDDIAQKEKSPKFYIKTIYNAR